MMNVINVETRRHSLDFRCSEWIQEEEKLSDRCAHIERMKRLVQPVQLGQGLYQLGNVVLHVLFSQEALPSDVIQRQADACLMEPDLTTKI